MRHIILCVAALCAFLSVAVACQRPVVETVETLEEYADKVLCPEVAEPPAITATVARLDAENTALALDRMVDRYQRMRVPDELRSLHAAVVAYYRETAAYFTLDAPAGSMPRDTRNRIADEMEALDPAAQQFFTEYCQRK